MKYLNRRQFLNYLSFTTAGMAAYSQNVFSTNALSSKNLLTNIRNIEEYVTVESTYGKLRGLREDGVNIFKGIPYAGSVSNKNRFKRPEKLTPWSGTRDALELGAPSIQDFRGSPSPAEDCLYLNLWTPANDNKKRPVMFYNHGGGYVTGSGGAGGQDGANLARYFDVVVVQTNHRLGLLGFLYLDEIGGEEYHGSGNMGVLDITAGLKWVNENIEVFGGDPENVMIFGESGGGGKTASLYAMPEASPYFNKASIESGPGVRMMTREAAAKTTEMVLKELNLSRNNWQRILDLSPEQLLEIQNKFSPVPPFQKKNRETLGFGPVVDGYTIPEHPFDPTAPKFSSNKPLLTGWNEDEFAFFIMQSNSGDLLTGDFDTLPDKLISDFGENTSNVISTYRRANPEMTASQILMAVRSITLMGLGSIEIAERKAEENLAPVYLYNFGYKSGMNIPGTDFPMGTPHAMDISYKFYNVLPPKDGSQSRGMFGGNSEESIKASYNFAELWTNFAKTGVPYASNAPKWPAYNLQERATMRIDTNCEVIYDRFKTELEMWRDIGELY